ncbi:MAG: hypothetical protein L0Y72_23545 [Gemmataceae bacterium]|nr:hypothetical protein [Gemmataceae bacterium]MCI0742019.1 hypothetical protein [Gemmataceae bacterium]
MNLQDGKYELTTSDNSLSLEVRVDINRFPARKIYEVSGDLYWKRSGKWVFDSSFSLRYLVPEDFAQTNRLHCRIGWSHVSGEADLFFLEGSAGELSAELRWDQVTYNLKVTGPVDAYRSFTFEVDFEEGLDAEFQTLNNPGVDSRTINSCFLGAGLGLTAELSQAFKNENQLPWRTNELHAALAKNFDRLSTGMSDVFYLIIARWYEKQNVTGIMFDLRERRGSAVFVDAIRNRYPDPGSFSNAYLRTVVHEIGHVLNLPHAFEAASRNSKKAASTSFMNYPHLYTGQGAGSEEQKASAYWHDFDFSFSPEEVYFLCHERPEKVYPGGNRYFGESLDVIDLPGSLRPAFLQDFQPPFHLELRLRPKREANLFQWGEPIHIELEFKNMRAAKGQFPGFGVNGGQLKVFIKTPRKEVIAFEPLFTFCAEREAQPLRKGSSTHLDMCLSYSGKGFQFIEPGPYQVWTLWSSPSGPISSNLLSLWVRYPTPAEETRLVPVLDDDVCVYLGLGGQPLLRNAERKLKDFSASDLSGDRKLRPDAHPLSRYFYMCRALLSANGFRRLGKGKPWPVPRNPDYALFQQTMALDSAFGFAVGIPSVFSNLLAGTVVATFADAMTSTGDAELLRGKKRLLQGFRTHLARQNPNASRRYENSIKSNSSQ